jgi:hypothetical protein
MLSIRIPFDALENFPYSQEICARTELFQVILESYIVCSFDFKTLKYEAGGELRNPSHFISSLLHFWLWELTRIEGLQA